MEFSFKSLRCWTCNNYFPPTCGTDRYCTIECRKEGRLKYKRLYYKKNAKKIYQQGLKYLPKRIARQQAMRIYRKLKITLCEECGGDYRPQVHHIDFNQFNNARENLVMLCQFHHVKAHGNGFHGLESSPGKSFSNKSSA